MGGGSAHDRRIRRRDPRTVAARVLNRASEAGAFDDLLGPALSNRPWRLAYGAEVVARAEAMVGRVGRIEYDRYWDTRTGRIPKIEFQIDGHDGEER